MTTSDLSSLFTARSGLVATFDDHVGTGTITDAADGRTWSFHCTQIADGSRTIPVDVAVTFELRPAPGGFEAVSVATPTA